MVLKSSAAMAGNAGVLGSLPDHLRNGEIKGASLQGLNGSVPLPARGARLSTQAAAFFGPALLVGVGYMDPGNWATDLQAGAQYRYSLLWVVALASVLAIILQVIAARLGLVTGKDLAQACRDHYPPWTRLPAWLLSEVAIIACDLAEVLGSAVALNLLFGLPLLAAVLVSAVDVLLLLALQRFGMRTMEAVILVLVATIALCYGIELFGLAGTRPDWAAVGHSLTRPTLAPGSATVAIGIIGATIMPHNLFLHSALVQSRRGAALAENRARAIRFNTLDTVVALGVALLINAAILLLAAAVFFGRSHAEVAGARYDFGPDADWIRVAYFTLTPLVGTGAASLLFGVALLASGQSSTITGTLAGQVVMEGFMRWRLDPWKRRLITRLLAILPAVAIIALRGGSSVNGLLVLSQVVLALQLPFAMIPLLHLTSRRTVMGSWRNGPVLLVAGWSSAALVLAFDAYGLPSAARTAWQVIAGVT